MSSWCACVVCICGVYSWCAFVVCICGVHFGGCICGVHFGGVHLWCAFWGVHFRCAFSVCVREVYLESASVEYTRAVHSWGTFRQW